MTDGERDTLLLEMRDSVRRLESGQKRLELYIRSMAGKLLAPAEIAELERHIEFMQPEVAAD